MSNIMIEDWSCQISCVCSEFWKYPNLHSTKIICFRIMAYQDIRVVGSTICCKNLPVAQGAPVHCRLV
jgi:hypothetical protein